MQILDWFLALLSGVMLAGMIKINGSLAASTTPLDASFVAHAVGAAAAAVFIYINLRGRAWRKRAIVPPALGKVPYWAYLGGIPGAFAVALSAITVNSALGLSAGVALLLAGQLLFGFDADAFGVLGTPRRRLTVHDLVSAILVVGGSVTLIYAGGAQ